MACYTYKNNKYRSREELESFLIEEQIQFQKALNKVGVDMIVNGFVYKNQVFLNKDVASNETAIHEFNHLFTSWLKENRKELYNKGIDLVKAELEKENNDISEIISYVKTNQPDLKGEAFYEELLTELTGRRGSELLNSKKKSGIIDWLKEFWNEIKDMLGLLEATPEQVYKMTLKEFADASAVQMLKGENFVELYDKASKFNNLEDFIESVSDFRDAHSAPSKDTTPTEDKLNTGGDFSLEEVAKGFHNQPDDYYTPNVGARYYGYNTTQGMESFTAINNIIRGTKAGKDNQTITAYRAVPNGVEINELKDYDWVTFSKTYAKNHGESRFGKGEYKIVKQDVPITDLWWDGNDINEWGYDTGNTKKYSRKELKDIWGYTKDNKKSFQQPSNIRFSKFAQLKEQNIKEYENKQLSPREEQIDKLRFIDPVIRLNEEAISQKTPSVKDVVNYAQADGKELTAQEKIELQDTIMSLGVNSSYQAEEMLRQALVTEGLISFNRNKMIDSGAFNSYEVSMILNSAEKQQKLRDVYQALKNTEEIVIEYDKNFVNKKAELNSFGKQVVLNPFILEEQILDTLEVPEGVEYEIPEGLRQAKQLDVNGNQKTEGTDTKDTLELSYIDDYNETMAENIDFITNGFSANVWESKKDAVAKIVKQIKKDAVNNGIDLKDIEAKVYSKSRVEIINFFNALEDFLETGDATVFAEAYNEMFDLNKPLTQTIYSDNNADVVINEPISEYKAFTELNLVKKSPTMYRKVKSLPLEQMYEIVATNKKKSVEEVQLEVRNNLTDVSDFEVDMESLEKITLWKDYFNFPKNSPELVVEKQDVEEVKKMNKKILKSNNPYLKTTKNGIEYVNEDPLTISRAEMTLPRKKEETSPVIEEDLLKAKRERAITNPKSINKLNYDYVYLQDNLVAVKNTSEDFIRTPRGIFEIVGKEGNLTLFQKVESSEKPMTEVNLESFNYLQTKPEVFMQAKKYYTKAELEKINKENFSCN